MTDEVSESMRLSFTVWCTAALLAAVIGVTVMSINVFNQYTGKYTDTMTLSAAGNISDLTSLKSVACPTVYSTVSAAIDTVSCVEFIPLSGSTRIIYQYNDLDGDNLIQLMTGETSTKFVRVSLTKDFGGLIKVTLREVER